jgi:hypothetical protein
MVALPTAFGGVAIQVARGLAGLSGPWKILDDLAQLGQIVFNSLDGMSLKEGELVIYRLCEVRPVPYLHPW